MDIACFVGLIGMRENPPRDDINQWLYEQSWLNSSDYKATYHRESARELRDVPVPIESWERFTQLFAWDQRDYENGTSGAGYLAAAVRSFFAQGGRRCYVIRVGDPLAFNAPAEARNTLRPKLIPGYSGSIAATPNDRNSWRGAGHLLGLPEVTMLCLPDLPDLMRVQPGAIDISEEPPDTPPEQFVVCSEPTPAKPPDNPVTQLPAPRCNESGFGHWANAISLLGQFIADYRPDVQLIAAVPLPEETMQAMPNLLEILHDPSPSTNQPGLGDPLDIDGIASAYVQLCYPWTRTAGSDLLPGRLEPPDGGIAGMLARNAISRGAYRSITGMRQTDIIDLYPRLDRQTIFAARDATAAGSALIDRVSLFGFSVDGVGAISDVTTSAAAAHRPANVNRIISMVRRTVQRTGEEFLFENNGEQLWAAITRRLNDVLRLLFDLGALRGKRPDDAFSVRCDRSTMTQQDLDQGRVVVLVHFEPAASIESIEVILTMRQNGTVTLASIGVGQDVA